jgi:hypothetical protein
MTEQDHASGVGDAKDVDAEPVGDDSGAIVLGSELRDRLALLHFGIQAIDGDFSTRRGVCHD